MQYQKLNNEQKSLRSWRMRRNHLACLLIDKGWPREKAASKAARMLRSGCNTIPAYEAPPRPAVKKMTHAEVCEFNLSQRHRPLLGSVGAALKNTCDPRAEVLGNPPQPRPMTRRLRAGDRYSDKSCTLTNSAMPSLPGAQSSLDGLNAQVVSPICGG